MNSKIENVLKKSLSLAEKKFKGDNTAEQFEKSNKDFKDLVSKGFVRERGYNLLSLSDNNSAPRIVFNAKNR